MIPKHISFSLYKYFESIKNLRQNGQILSFFHFSSLKNGKSMTFLNHDCERTEDRTTELQAPAMVFVSLQSKSKSLQWRLYDGL